MAEEIQPDINPTGPPAAPDPEKLKPVGLSNTYKRYIYWGVTAALALLILANIVGPKQSNSCNSTESPRTGAKGKSVTGSDPRLGEQPEAG